MDLISTTCFRFLINVPKECKGYISNNRDPDLNIKHFKYFETCTESCFKTRPLLFVL